MRGLIELEADVPLLMDFSLVITKYEITGAKPLSLHCQLTAAIPVLKRVVLCH